MASSILRLVVGLIMVLLATRTITVVKNDHHTDIIILFITIITIVANSITTIITIRVTIIIIIIV